MKTKIFKYISILLIFFGIQQSYGQTSFNLGGHSLILKNGFYFELMGNDSIRIDTLCFTIKFQAGSEDIGNQLISTTGFQKIYTNRDNTCSFNIPQTMRYIEAYNFLNTENVIEEIHLEHHIPVYSEQYVTPDDEHLFDPWELKKSNIMYDENAIEFPDYAWVLTVGNPCVIVALLDDGLVWSDADFSPDNHLGYDYIQDDNDVEPAPGHSSHGTAMSSIIAARTANQHGLCGIAGGYKDSIDPVTLLIQKVMEWVWTTDGWKCYVRTSVVPGAIEEAVNKGARVINMSWGNRYWFDQDIDNAIEYAVEHDVVLFAAVGNENNRENPYPPFEIAWPASHPDVIAVSAMQVEYSSGEESRWNTFMHGDGSNRGEETEITFPGSLIETTNLPLSQITSQGSGTSISTAMASGVAALMLSVNPCLTCEEVRANLRQSCRQFGGYDYDENGHSIDVGFGLVNAYTAVSLSIPHDDMVIAPNENITYNHDFVLSGTITIENFGVLNIENCIVTAKKGTKIIVKPGGKLFINNSTITSYCASPWEGIEVWGSVTQTQWPSNGDYSQGYVELNSATIENAELALNLWKPDDYTKTGGIVIANDSRFRNNRESVHALLYTNHHPISGKPMDYQAVFTNCIFEITPDFLSCYFQFYKHIDLNKVNGVRFYGCDFSLSPEAQGISYYNQAIAAYSSGFKVNAICEIAGENGCNQYDKSTFTGFYRGIYAGNGSTLSNTFTVNRADFTDNAAGIEVNGVTKHTILFCNFKLGPNRGDAGACNLSGAPSFGIDMDGSNGFIIEENEFRKNVGAPQGVYVGIRCKDGKSLQDVIYRNIFDGLSYGNYAEGLNRKDPETDIFGLQFMCNTNQNNAIDFIVAQKDPDDRPMIHTFQGTRDLEAKNTFSANPLPDGNFMNQGRQVVNYYFNTDEPVEHTQTFVNPIRTTAVNNCISNYGGINPKTIVLNESQKLQRELDFATNLSNFNNVKILRDNLEDGGNTEGLKMEVNTSWPQDMWELRAKLLGNSPHLSEEVLKTAADKTEVLPESVLFEILSANPDELRKESLIEYLETKAQPLPEYMISILQQLAGGITYKTVLMQDMARYEAEKTKAAYDLIRSCLNDTEIDMDFLRDWYDNLNCLDADYEIVASYLTEKNYNAATTMLDIIPALRNLAGIDLEEFEEYKDLVLWQIQLNQQGGDVTSINDASFDMLLETAENSIGRAGMQARAILEYGKDYHFDKCLPEATQSAVKTEQVNTISYENGISVEANPNPANAWVSFNYSLPFNVIGGELLVTDMKGRMVTSFQISGSAGQQVWDTRQVDKGIYVYTLKVGNMSKQGKLVIQ